MVRGFVVAEAAQGFDHRVLRLGLASIDHVVDFGDVAEVRMIFLAVGGRNPTLVLIGIAIELAIAEIAPQQAELPHVVCDVFADVADGAVGADDYFLIFFGNLLGLVCVPCVFGVEAVPARRMTQQPLFLPSFSKVSTPASFSLTKAASQKCRCRISLSRGQEIVFDVEAVHGFEVAAQDGGRDQFGDGRGFAGGVFDGVQRPGAGLQILLVLLVPLRDAGVEIPAVVIEAGLAGQSFDFSAGLFLDCMKPTTTSATCTPVLSM